MITLLLDQPEEVPAPPPPPPDPDPVWNGKRHGNARWDAHHLILVHNRMGPEWLNAVAYSAAAWRAIFPRLYLATENKGMPGPGVVCPEVPGVINVCKLNPTLPEVGSTYTATSGHEITAATVLVRSLPTYKGVWGAGPASNFDMTTLAHELGHALGLTHNPYPLTSCMNSHSELITPGPYDRNSLEILYARNW